jgi:nicotinate-nucleotide adenylyltransferase
MKINRIGIYGGSFDPVHNGHLITVKNVIEKRKLDKVILVPTYISPFKLDKKATDEDHRINMLNLAIKNEAKFEVSLVEIERSGISYTIDTIKHFSDKYDNIDLIIGFDNMVEFDKWKYPDEILKICNVVVMKRNIDMNDRRNSFMDKVIYVDTPIVDISSSLIRENVKNNVSITSLVPENVKDYILANKLYQK